MANVRPILICVMAFAVHFAPPLVAQQSGLVPISPQEEQGRRAVLTGFGRDHLGESFQQEEELPVPNSASRSGEERLSVDDGQTQQANSLAGEPVRQRYPDGKVQVLRYVRQDEYGNFYNDGPWKLFNRAGQVMAEGQFEDGAMHGTWTRWHPTNSDGIFRTPPFASQQGPFLSIASFNHGKLDGVWTIYDRSRRKIFEMQYVNGQRQGAATWWSNSGYLIREMQFEQGLISGEVIEYDSAQKPVKKTNYVNGRREFSQVTWYRQNQKKSEDFFLDAKLELNESDNWWDAKPAEYSKNGQPVRHGFTRTWFENGQLSMEGKYEEGLKSGDFTWWFLNGQQRLAGTFDKGQRVGQWTWWHENGMKSVSGSYDANRPIGMWRWWDEEGKVVRSGDVGAGEINLPAETPHESNSDTPNLNPPAIENLEDISPDDRPRDQ